MTSRSVLIEIYEHASQGILKSTLETKIIAALKTKDADLSKVLIVKHGEAGVRDGLGNRKIFIKITASTENTFKTFAEIMKPLGNFPIINILSLE